jgi:spore germination cell wall hydrolase CwlJ-like protein
MSGTDRDDLFPSPLQKLIRTGAVAAGVMLGSAGALAVPELIGPESLPKALASLKSLTRTAEFKLTLGGDKLDLPPDERPSAAQPAAPAQIASAEPPAFPSRIADAEPVAPPVAAPRMPAPAMPVVPAAPAVTAPTETDAAKAVSGPGENKPAPAKPAAPTLAPNRFLTAAVTPPGEPLVSSIEMLSPQLSVTAPAAATPVATARLDDIAPAKHAIAPNTTSHDAFASAPAVAAEQPVKQAAVELPALAPLPLERPHDIPGPSPAERLALTGQARAKAEKCLAQAIYFEARNQPQRGQAAVAQVVINRVFSPYYPNEVCAVVYQNAHRRLACQFTFACDGHPEYVRERGAWYRAQRIARQTLDGQIWLPEVGKSTHYHAAYVRPRWVREMRTMARHGLHTFYRPRRWGDGSNEPSWGLASVRRTKG